MTAGRCMKVKSYTTNRNMGLRSMPTPVKCRLGRGIHLRLSGKKAESVSERRRFLVADMLQWEKGGGSHGEKPDTSGDQCRFGRGMGACNGRFRADWRSDVKKIKWCRQGASLSNMQRTARRQPLPLRPNIRISDMNLPWKTSSLSGRWTGRFAGIDGRRTTGISR